MRSDLSAAARARRLLPALAGTWCLLVAASRPTVPPTSSLAEVAMRGDLRSMRSMLGACVESKAPRGDVRASKTLNPACDVNAAMGDGMTALHWAAERGDSAMTALLLKTGAKLDATTKAGANTPLHVASRSGNASVVRALLKAGADANARTTGGASALHLAATAGNADAVEALIAAKANVNATEPE